MDARLIVFFKMPLPGRVKSRLARAIGHEMAAHLYYRLLMRTRMVAGQAATILSRHACLPRRLMPRQARRRQASRGSGEPRRGQAATVVSLLK